MTTGTGSIDVSAVEEHDGITVIRGGGSQRGWNGILYKQGLSGKNAGSQSLSINVATVPPGAVAFAHIHDGFEVMLFIVQGRVKHTFGEGLRHEVINESGDFIYIKPGVPHEVFNIGASTEITIQELAQRVIERTGSSSRIRHVPYEEAYGEGFEELGSRKPDTSAIEELCGWQPRRTIDDAIDDLVAHERGAPRLDSRTLDAVHISGVEAAL